MPTGDDDRRTVKPEAAGVNKGYRWQAPDIDPDVDYPMAVLESVPAGSVVTPAARIVRTVLWTTLAVLGAVPTAAAMAGLPAAVAAKVAAVTGALALLITVAVNVLEQLGVIPPVTLGQKTTRGDR